MKFNLVALSEFNFEELGMFLSWLGEARLDEMTLEQMKKSPPVRTSKVGAIVKVLEAFGLISRRQERYSLTAAGKDYVRSGGMVRKAVLRKLFRQLEPVQRILDVLTTSSTGCMPRRLVAEAFRAGSLSVVIDAEIDAFVAWAQASELFGYDKRTDEIYRLETGTPRSPMESLKRQEPGASIPRAS